MHRFLVVLSVCAVLTVPALAIPNVTLYDSTGDSFDGPATLAGCGCAFSFSAPAFASNLIDVKISLLHPSVPATRATPLFGPRAAARTAPAISVGSLSLALYSNNPTGPQPASQLITLGSPLSDSSLTSSPVLYDFPPGAPFALTPGARYWVFITSNNSIASAAISDASAGTGVANEFTWEGTTDPNSSGSVLGLVVATPVTPGIPVPPSVVLTLIGLAFVGFYIAGRRFVSV